MGDDKKYSIISMADDDEEIVIQAGIAPSPSEEGAPKEAQEEVPALDVGPLEEQAEEVTPAPTKEKARQKAEDDG
ncbi:MAG: hypothetical protein FWD72_00490, partial [Eggerthellaceae bacterium]|nr:hypothetical protein [Eggerthellaceae bacterium]